MVDERVTMATGVPTVWIGVLEALEKNPKRWKFDWPMRVICGGTAPPLELIRSLDRYGIRMVHLWGMTETTPLGDDGASEIAHARLERRKQNIRRRAKQGWPVPFVELRITRPSENEQGIGRSSLGWRNGRASWKCEGRGWRPNYLRISGSGASLDGRRMV